MSVSTFTQFIMSRAADWFRERRFFRRNVRTATDKPGQDEASLDEAKAAARQYLEEAGYYRGRAPHVVSSGHAGALLNPVPSGNAAGLQTQTQRRTESSDEGDTALAPAAAITVGLESNRGSDSAPNNATSGFPGFNGGDSGGGGASDTWDSPSPD
jgi:uncharacterized membrane protein YgcG